MCKPDLSSLLGAALLLCTTVSLRAAPPVITTMDVRGLQIGKTTTITITGTDLLPNPRLLTTAGITKQTLKAGARPEKITVEVELSPDAQPGLENAWLVTDNGVSTRSTVAIDAFPQTAVVDEVESLPVSMHGTLAGSQVREVTFTGKAGQDIICEVEAQRLESKLRPALKLFGPGNNMIKLGLPLTSLRGDTRIETKLPADGSYRLQVHDLQFAATAPAHYRLKIGRWQYADLAHPSTVQRGKSADVQLIGPEGQTQAASLPSSASGPAVPASWPNSANASGPQAAVWLSDLPELLEASNHSSPQPLPALPVAVNGVISTPGEEDAYELQVKPETEIDLDVIADAHGSPIDAELELRDLKGTRLAINDDSPDGPDPRLTFKVPKGVTKIIAMVRDVNGNSGPRCIYRLHIAEKTKSSNFALKVTEDSHTLEPARTSIFKVEALRDGYDGPIDLAFDHLPDGIKLTGQAIPVQATGTLLTLTSDKPMQPVITALKGRAKDNKDDETLAQFDSSVLGKFQPWLARELALAGAPKSEIPFTVTSETKSKTIPLSGKLSVIVKCTRPVGHDGPVRLTLLTSQARIFLKGAVDPARNLREDKVVLIEDDKKAQAAFDAVTAATTALTKAEATLATAKKAEETARKAADVAADKAKAAATAAAKVVEAEAGKAKAAADAAIAKTPATPAPALVAKPPVAPAVTAANTAADAATKAAATAATVVAASTKAVADAMKSLATAQAAIAPAEKAATDAALKAKNDVEVTLVVPPDLAEVPHQIAFKAELLKRDRRTVEAIAYTPVQSLPVINPIVVKATPLAAVKLDAKAGATVDLIGQIERLEGAKGDVALTLAGLPAGVTAAPATLNVKAAESQFKFALKFPATYKPAEPAKITLSATAKPYGTIQTKSRDAVVALNVLQADPLPPAPPAAAKPAVTPPAKPAATAATPPPGKTATPPTAKAKPPVAPATTQSAKPTATPVGNK